MCACGAGVRAEPFLHVGLVLVLGGLVFEYIGDLADLLVISLGSFGALYWGGRQGRGKSSSRGGVCRMWSLVLGRGGIQVG